MVTLPNLWKPPAEPYPVRVVQYKKGKVVRTASGRPEQVKRKLARPK